MSLLRQLGAACDGRMQYEDMRLYDHYVFIWQAFNASRGEKSILIAMPAFITLIIYFVLCKS